MPATVSAVPKATAVPMISTSAYAAAAAGLFFASRSMRSNARSAFSSPRSMRAFVVVLTVPPSIENRRCGRAPSMQWQDGSR